MGQLKSGAAKMVKVILHDNEEGLVVSVWCRTYWDFIWQLGAPFQRDAPSNRRGKVAAFWKRRNLWNQGSSFCGRIYSIASWIASFSIPLPTFIWLSRQYNSNHLQAAPPLQYDFAHSQDLCSRLWEWRIARSKWCCNGLLHGSEWRPRKLYLEQNDWTQRKHAYCPAAVLVRADRRGTIFRFILFPKKSFQGRILHFIDAGVALPSPQLTYEIFFDSADEANKAPVFRQSEYRIQVGK